jgi:hypothetical protein
MMKITYAIPSCLIIGGELIAVNALDCEKCTSAHVMTEESTFLKLLAELCAVVEELTNISKFIES